MLPQLYFEPHNSAFYHPGFLKEADNLQQKLNIGSIIHVSMNYTHIVGIFSRVPPLNSTFFFSKNETAFASITSLFP